MRYLQRGDIFITEPGCANKGCQKTSKGTETNQDKTYFSRSQLNVKTVPKNLGHLISLLVER